MVAIVAIVAPPDSSLSALKKTSRQPVMPLSSSHSHLTIGLFRRLESRRAFQDLTACRGGTSPDAPRPARACLLSRPTRRQTIASRLGNPPTGSSPARDDHRAPPTWAPAKGHEEQGGAGMFGPSKKHSKLDDNAHTILKTRAVGQMSVKELVARDFKAELLAKEAKHFKRKLPEAGGDLMIGDGEARGSERVRSIDGPLDGDAGPSGSDAPAFEPKRVDADDSDDDDDDDDDDDESDSEDDTACFTRRARAHVKRARRRSDVSSPRGG